MSGSMSGCRGGTRRGPSSQRKHTSALQDKGAPCPRCGPPECHGFTLDQSLLWWFHKREKVAEDKSPAPHQKRVTPVWVSGQGSQSPRLGLDLSGGKCQPFPHGRRVRKRHNMRLHVGAGVLPLVSQNPRKLSADRVSMRPNSQPGPGTDMKSRLRKEEEAEGWRVSSRTRKQK